VAQPAEAEQLLAQIRKDRYPDAAQFRDALGRAGISEAELKQQLLWQLTVLRFIDARFRPEVVISDEEIARYRSTHPMSEQAASDQLAGERINTLLDDWLKQARSQARIEYLEKSLQ
jgi:uncharacterized protein YqiB (DUF1249 family)